MQVLPHRSTRSRGCKDTKMAFWWWLVQKHTTDRSLTRDDEDSFIQVAALTVIKENETLRIVCMLRRGGRKTRRKRGSVHSHVWIKTSSFWGSAIRKLRHTFCSGDAHAENICRQEASFPALLYLTHIKYHFPEKSVSSLLATRWSYPDYGHRLLPKIGFLSVCI